MDSNNLGIPNTDFKLKSQQEGVGLDTKNCLPKRMYTASSPRGLERTWKHLSDRVVLADGSRSSS